MAKAIKRVVSRRDKYPWDLWTDGKPRRAIKGSDFKCSVLGFKSALHQTAKRRGMTVQVSYDDKTVDFQFFKSK